MSLDAMKQALEALEELNKAIIGVDAVCLPGEVDTAMDALRLAIEQAERQEPYGYFRYDMRLDAWVQSRDSDKGVPFYTAPPQREWVSLTKEEILKLLCIHPGENDDEDEYDDEIQDVRTIEAKLREKNAAPPQRQPLNLGNYINDADISAADMPHTVVQKLQAAIERKHGIGGGE